MPPDDVFIADLPALLQANLSDTDVLVAERTSASEPDAALRTRKLAVGALLGAVRASVTALSTSLTTALNGKADAAATTSALALKAPLASPAFTGAPTAPTPSTNDSSTRLATTALVAAKIAAALAANGGDGLTQQQIEDLISSAVVDLVGGAPSNLNTFGEVAQALSAHYADFDEEVLIRSNTDIVLATAIDGKANVNHIHNNSILRVGTLANPPANLAEGEGWIATDYPDPVQGGVSVSPVVVALTGTTTLTETAIGKNHVCLDIPGAPDNYSVTLPNPADFPNQFIEFEMDDSLTKLVTLVGNINGSNRVIWKGETAKLRSNGVMWLKKSGRSIPHSAFSEVASEVAIPNGQTKFIPIDSLISESVLGIVELGSGFLRIPRDNTYFVDAFISAQVNGAYPGYQSYTWFSVNSILSDVPSFPSAVSVVPTALDFNHTYMHVGINMPRKLNRNDYVALGCLQSTGQTMTTRTPSVVRCHLNIVEQPGW